MEIQEIRKQTQSIYNSRLKAKILREMIVNQYLITNAKQHSKTRVACRTR